MKTRKLALALIALSLYATSTHATNASAAMRFTGLVYVPASAAIVSDTTAYASIADRHVDSMSHAQSTLHSDVLDYYATYAAKDAKLVSVSYQ
jgi:hypothetical protein